MISRAYRTDRPYFVTGLGQINSVVLCDEHALGVGEIPALGVALGDVGCGACKGTLTFEGVQLAAKVVWPKDVEREVLPEAPGHDQDVDITVMEPVTFGDLDEVREMLRRASKRKPIRAYFRR